MLPMKSSLLSSPILTVILLISFGYLAINVALSAVDRTGNDSGQEVLMGQVDALMQEKKALEDELTWTATEEFVEQEARNKLYLVKSNETVVIYPEESEVLAARAGVASDKRRATSEADRAGHVGDWLSIFGF